MADDVYKIKADVSQYTDAIDKLVTAHEKLLRAEDLHVTKLSSIDAAEKGATHSIIGITKAGLAFSSTFKTANGILEQTAAKLEVLKHKGGQSVAESIKRTILGQQGSVSTPQVIKIDKAVSDLDKLLAANKFTKKQLEATWHSVQIGVASKLEGELGKVQKVFKTLNKLTAVKEIKAVTPDTGQSGALAAKMASDVAYNDQAQALLAKRVAASQAASDKLVAIEQKNSTELVAIKRQASKAIRDIKKQETTQLKAVENLTGVRAQSKARVEVEKKATSEIVKIGEKRKKAQDLLLTRLNAGRKAYNDTVVKDEKATVDKLLSLNKKYEAAVTASQEKLAGEAQVRAAKEEETLRAGRDRALVTSLPIGKKVQATDVLDLHKAEETLLRFLAKNRRGIESQKVSIKKLNVVWKEVAQGNIQRYGAELTEVQHLIKNVMLAHSQANAAAGVSTNRQIQQSHALSGVLRKQQDQLVGMTLSWKTMFRLMVSQGTSRLLSGFLNELREARDLSLDLTKEFARIQTLDNTASPVSAWIDGVRELSEESGIDILDLTKASYEALSNQIGEGTQALGLMTAASDLAIVSGATAAQSQELLADAIHAWGLETSDASSIAATFFKIVDLGRATVAEMAPNLGRVSIPAAQLGVTLEETGAAIATMTIKGVKLETASTLLRNVLLKLAKPSEDMKELMGELGFNTGESWIATRGLGGVMADLEAKTKGSSTELAKQLRNIRAITGATIFAGHGLEVYNKNLVDISTATVNYDSNVNLVKNSLGQLYDKATQKIENIFTFDTAKPMIQTVADLTNNFDGLVTVVEVGRVVFAGLAGVAIPAAILGIGQLIIATAGLGKAMLVLAGPVLGTGALIASVALGVAGVWLSTSEDIEAKNTEVFNDWVKHYNNVEEASRKTKAAIQKDSDEAFKEALRPVREYIAEVNKQFNSVEGITKRSIKNFNADVSEIQRQATVTAQASISATRRQISQLESDIKALRSIAAQSVPSALKADLVGETGIEKLLTLNKEIERLNTLRAKATTGKEFKDLTQQINAATGQKTSLLLELNADPTKLEDEYNKALDRLDAKLQIFLNRGDEVGAQRIRQEYDQILKMFKGEDKGANFLREDANELRGYAEDIAQVKKEMTQADPASDLFQNLKQELSYLQDQKGALAAVFQSERAASNQANLVAAKKEEAAQALKLAAILEQEKKKEEASFKLQVDRLASISADYKKLLSYKVEEYSTTEKLNTALAEQLELVSKIRAAGGGQLAGAEQQLRDRADTARESAAFTDKAAGFEALIRNSEAEKLKANASLDAATTAITKNATAIADFAKGFGIEAPRAIQPSTPGELFSAKFFDVLDRRADVLVQAIHGNLANPLQALLNLGEAQVQAKFDPKIFETFANSMDDINLMAQAALGASESDVQLAIFKQLFEEMDLISPEAQAVRDVDVKALSAEERMAYQDQLDKLTDMEQAFINLANLDAASGLGTAKEDFAAKQADLFAILDARAQLDASQFAPVVQSTQAQTSATVELTGVMKSLTTQGAPNLRVLPQRIVSDQPTQQVLGDTITNTYHIATRDFDAQAVAKKLEPAITRLQRLAHRGN